MELVLVKDPELEPMTSPRFLPRRAGASFWQAEESLLSSSLFLLPEEPGS